MFISRYTLSRSNEKFPVLSAHDPCVTCYGGPLTESFFLYINALSHLSSGWHGACPLKERITKLYKLTVNPSNVFTYPYICDEFLKKKSIQEESANKNTENGSLSNRG